MDRLFDDLGRGWGLAPFRFLEPKTFTDLMPRMDIVETDKEIKVTAELPGMDEKDVDVSLEGDQLTLKGEKKAESEEKGKSFHRVERSYGTFPSGADRSPPRSIRPKSRRPSRKACSR
jgi:HSP20 family protein